MAMGESVGRIGYWAGCLSIIGILIANDVFALANPVGMDPTNPLIRESALVIFWFWLFSSGILVASSDPRLEDVSQFNQGRGLFTVGCILCLLHVAIAFHLAHGWSHEAAYENTERVSGFGPGIFVNYFFISVWVANVLWQWINLDHYLKRPRWLKRLTFSFMWFIFFNAVFVFGHGIPRWAGLAFLLIQPILYSLVQRYVRI